MTTESENLYKWYVIYHRVRPYNGIELQKTKEFSCIGEAQKKAEELLAGNFEIKNVMVAQSKFYYSRKIDIEKVVL